MSKIVDLQTSRDKARHRRKEEKFKSLQERFEKALPIDKEDPKDKLLNIFKKKK